MTSKNRTRIKQKAAKRDEISALVRFLEAVNA